MLRYCVQQCCRALPLHCTTINWKLPFGSICMCYGLGWICFLFVHTHISFIKMQQYTNTHDIVMFWIAFVFSSVHLTCGRLKFISWNNHLIFTVATSPPCFSVATGMGIKERNLREESWKRLEKEWMNVDIGYRDIQSYLGKPLHPRPQAQTWGNKL